MQHQNTEEIKDNFEKTCQIFSQTTATVNKTLTKTQV